MRLSNFYFFALFITISFHSMAEILPNYNCGIGPVSKVLSYGLSSTCGREKLNKCCYSHDRCYDRNHGADDLILEECDTNFEECIEWAYKRQSFFCTKFLEFTHSGAVRFFGKVYRKLFGYNPITELMMTDTESNNTMRIGRTIRAERLSLANVTKID